MNTRLLAGVCAILAVTALGGCDDSAGPGDDLSLNVQPADVAPPAPLVSVDGVEFWPYTGDDFMGIPKDPINLIFAGSADPRDLRAALLSLDDDRSALAAYPELAMFAGVDCTWHDVPEGGVQTAYGSSAGWVGSAIQVACGDFGPVRFHLRFFEIGGITLGGAHFEVQVPGTTDHQVVSWEFAEGLVIADVVRTGIGGPLGASGLINDAPFRTIPAIIYDGLPDDLKYIILASGGVVDPGTGDVGIGTDGQATILYLGGTIEGEKMVARNEFTIDFDQTIPKPICSSSEFDYLMVTGPVRLRQQVVVTPSGNYLSHFHALGDLDLVPINLATGDVGEAYRAHVNEIHKGIYTDRVTQASQFVLQIEIPQKGPFRGALRSTMQVGPGGASHSSITVRCDP